MSLDKGKRGTKQKIFARLLSSKKAQIKNDQMQGESEKRLWLPTELWHSVLIYLSDHELCCIRLVNSVWR